MGLGFTRNGRHTSEFGIIMRSKRKIIAAARQQYETIPGKHGSYDFSDDTLEDIIIEADCDFSERSIPDLRYKARQIAAWLFGKGEIVFDDEPDLLYIGRLVNQVGLETTMGLGQFTLQFRCHPLAQAIENAADCYDLNSDITLYRDLRLDGDDYSFDVTAPATVEVNNWGTAPVAPVIVVEGNLTNITLATGGKNLQYNEPLDGEILTIDCDKFQAYIGEANKLNKVSGDLLELTTGINQITIGGTGLNCTVSFIFKPKFY